MSTNTIVQMIITIVCSILALSGFWTYLQSHANKNSAEKELLIGLAHDRIIYLGMEYINRGYITQDEYEDLNKYLYIPYKKNGGNGSAERVMNEVDRLPLHRGEGSTFMKEGIR